MEIKPERNNRWLNSHMDPLMKVWQANMDMPLTIDLGKVIGYMTKSEALLTKDTQKMIEQKITKSIED